MRNSDQPQLWLATRYGRKQRRPLIGPATTTPAPDDLRLEDIWRERFGSDMPLRRRMRPRLMLRPALLFLAYIVEQRYGHLIEEAFDLARWVARADRDIDDEFWCAFSRAEMYADTGETLFAILSIGEAAAYAAQVDVYWSLPDRPNGAA